MEQRVIYSRKEEVFIMSIMIIILVFMLLSHTTFLPVDTVSQKSDELNTQTIETYIEEETTEEVVESEPTSEATTEATTEEVIVEEQTTEAITEEPTTEAITEETTYEATTETTTDATTEEVVQEPTTTAGDLGILSIPDAGIYVGLYSDANAFQSSGKASVQYYTQYGVKWIADHVNQDGFGNLKYLSVGSKVYINDSEYTVVDNVYAADYYSNFAAWSSYIGDSTLVLQTCEGDGARLVRCQ